MHAVVTLVAKYFVVIPVVVLAIVALRLDPRKRLEFCAFVLLSVVLTALFVKLATMLHSDPRPFVRDGVTPYFSSATDNGFPSDHTTFSAAIAFIVLKYSKKLGVALVVLAILIGAARVIGGVHHAQDIIAGLFVAVVGVGSSSVLVDMARKYGLKNIPNKGFKS